MKYWMLGLLFVILICFLTLSPTLGLHLSGDDYQSLWRYKLYGNEWNSLQILLTDYGPQDLTTAFIAKYFNFLPFYYYLFSLVFRILASLSFFPLVFYMTKSKTSAYASTIFFAITITGLESSDWVFNLPVYISIFFLNFFFLTWIKSKDNSNKIAWLSFSAIFFLLAIISMPIRLLFLPLFIFVIEFYSFIRNRSFSNAKLALMRLLIFSLVFIVILSSGNIGASIGWGNSETSKVSEEGFSKLYNYFSGISAPFTEGKYDLFLYPVGQIGFTFFPSNFIKPHWELWSNLRLLAVIVLPSIASIFLASYLIKITYVKIKTSGQRFGIFFSMLWSLFIFLVYRLTLTYPVSTSIFVSLLFGGYFLIWFAVIFISNIKNLQFAFYMFFTIILMTFSFAQYWIRNPDTIQISYNRYLIIPAVGLSIFLGVLLGFTKRKIPIGIIFVCLLFAHVFSSYTYLSNIAQKREYTVTDGIRKSVPNVFTRENLSKPMIFYFEPQGSEILYHSLLFGFPVIMAIQYNFQDIENIAYTESWSEVVSAYQTGESLKRFGTKLEPVAIENVFSYKLEGERLIDTTPEVRSRLLQLSE